MDEIERLTKLHEAFEIQKKKVLILLEIDIKKIGTSKVCDYIKEDAGYLHRIFHGSYVTYKKIIDLWNKVDALKKLLEPNND